jgi:isopenicillin N synthase-like dioxygenase
MTASDFDAIPVIGLGGPVDRVVADIVRACETAGFFYCVDHGVALAKIDAILDAARWLFGRPRAELASLDVATSPNFRGYVPMATAGPGVPLRLLEAFQMMLDLGPDDPDVRAGNIMYGPNRWPPGAGAFRAAMEDYYAEMTALSRRLLDLFARGLGLAPDHFESFFRKPLTQLRLLHYPPQPPDDPEARGVETHTDTGAFTILLQDETGGLEVRNRAGRWIPATPVPGGFVINIADMMQRWTGGRFVSTPHRVANRTGRDRYSVPFFANPDYDAIITPLAPGSRDAPLACGPYVEAAYRAAWPRAT